MTQEEKAKAYDEVREKIALRFGSNVAKEIFSKFEESEDEKIRKEIMDFIDTKTIDSDERRNRWFSYLEKYKPISFTSLEDTKVKMSLMRYISELNQDVVHLHPCIETCNEWLAWLEKQGEQKPMWIEGDEESNVNDETNAPTEYGKYVDECLNEASKHFFSEGEDEYSVADLFYAGVRCGKSWLEKQGETYTKRDVDNAYLEGVAFAKNELEKQILANSAKTCKANTLKVKEVDLEEEFASLLHIDDDKKRTCIDWGYSPNLYHFDGAWHVTWIHCSEGDTFMDFSGETIKEAIKKASDWFHSTFSNC